MELQLLDDLLYTFLKHREHISYENLINILHSDYPYTKQVSDTVIYAAIRKLIKDGHVTSVKETVSIGTSHLAEFTYFEISFDGIVFSKSQGYVWRKQDLDRRNRREVRNRNQLLFLNGVLVLGTLVACIYYLIQIFSPAQPIVKVVLTK